MIAAVGRFDIEPMLTAIRVMALNDNPAYDHEHRSLGTEIVHDCGWGAAFPGRDGLVTRRSTAPCFESGELERLGDELMDLSEPVNLLLLHARRTRQRDTIALRNTHPFRAAWKGLEYAFCHNGEVRDLSQLSWDEDLSPRGEVDSERLFLHVLTRLDPERRAASMAAALAPLRDFTCINCLLVVGDTVTACTRMAPDSPSPRYYTLWRGRGDGLDVVSSEIVAGLDVEWSAVPDGTALMLGSVAPRS